MCIWDLGLAPSFSKSVVPVEQSSKSNPDKRGKFQDIWNQVVVEAKNQGDSFQFGVPEEEADNAHIG